MDDETGWKSAKPLSFSLDESKEGDVLVAFAKADGTTVDSDGHITDPGAFPTKSVPISSYGHTSWPDKGARLPTGIADIGEEGGEARAKGHFLVDTTHGRDTYLTVKALGALQEWSYGYRILDHTREKLSSAKAGVVLRLKKLDVREISPTLVGAGIGTRTMAIKSADEEGPLAGLPYAEHLERVLLEVGDVVERSKSLRDLRVKDGRELSEANRSRLVRLRESIATLEETKAELEDLLARTERTDPDAKAAGVDLFLQYQATVAALEGVAVTFGG